MKTHVAAILPCRGRREQTARLIPRLLRTASYADWQLWCIGGVDEYDVLLECGNAGAHTFLEMDRPRLTYWEALAEGSDMTDAPLLCNLANDLLPGQQWLARAVAAYQRTFGDGDGLLGFNDGHHPVSHSCHFLISRTLLARYGGWPVWYDHNFGDTELCARAIEDRRYAKAPWATLFHDHPMFGGEDDAVYAAGRAMFDRDRRIFAERQRNGWAS